MNGLQERNTDNERYFDADLGVWFDVTLVSCKTGEEQLSLEKQELGGDLVIMKNEKQNSSKKESGKKKKLRSLEAGVFGVRKLFSNCTMA